MFKSYSKAICNSMEQLLVAVMVLKTFQRCRLKCATILKGQLGVGKDIKYQHEPEAIPSDFLPRPVIQIACGEATSAAVTGEKYFTHDIGTQERMLNVYNHTSPDSHINRVSQCCAGP